MAVKTTNKSGFDFFPEWSFTPEGAFRNKTTGRVLSRKQWEVEVSYQAADNPRALAAAKDLAAKAEAKQQRLKGISPA